MEEGEVTDDCVKRRSTELLRISRELVVRHVQELGAARGACRFDQRRRTVYTDNGDAVLSERSSQPTLAATNIEHSTRLQGRNSGDHGIVGSNAPAFDLAIAHDSRPGAGIGIPTSSKLVVVMLRQV